MSVCSENAVRIIRERCPRVIRTLSNEDLLYRRVGRGDKEQESSYVLWEKANIINEGKYYKFNYESDY